MWNVVFVMGFENLSTTARVMELGQPARRFFSPLYLVAMTLSCYRPKQRMRNVPLQYIHVCV